MIILSINPWIYDFAAYDFWLKPYGFLVILTYLKEKGVTVDYIDCLDKKISLDKFGRGKYPSEIIEKPEIFKSIPRYFKRYGIAKEELENNLSNKHPDYILITSSMTYWYPAIIDLLKIIKEKFPLIPAIIGGTYATLCYEHAQKHIPVDFIFKNASLEEFFKLLKLDYNFYDLYSTLPCYEDFYNSIDYVVLRTSWGCPFNCSYCAIKELFPDFFLLPQETVLNFIVKYACKGHKHFVFYDDALLYEQAYIKKLLRKINKLKLNIHFHTPNALHFRFLDEEIASLLKSTGFTNPHFGLETMDTKLQKLWGDKVTRDDVINGVNLLKKGGFKNGEFSVYLLLGYPQQNLENLKEDVDFLNSLGVKVSFAEFSPVPKTKLFEEYKDSFSEPLLQNNSIFGSFQQERIKDFWEIKNYVRELNKIIK